MNAIPDLAHAKAELARSHGTPDEAFVKAAVYKKFPELAHTAKAEIVVPVWKDDAEQLIYGVVLTPDLVDSQGDIAGAGEIQKAAHRFLSDVRAHDIQHAESAAGVETVESFIAPCDFELAGEKVLKGAWVMVTHVSDPAVWQRVTKGELTGYSIGGTAVREIATLP